MKHSPSLLLGLTLVALGADAASAQVVGRRSGNVATPYGVFSPGEMAAAGRDPMMALQFRQQQQLMQQQMQMMKQQQQFEKQQKSQADYLKKHPEAAQALRQSQFQPTRTATKKAAKTKKAATKPAATATEAGTTTPAPAGDSAAKKDAKPAEGSLKAKREG